MKIYQGVYDEDVMFFELKSRTPVADPLSKKAKLRSRTPHRPTDDTVMEFLSEAFPHLYLVDFPPSSKKVVWGETMSGPSHATSERVSINEELTNVWLVKASTPAVSRIALAFLFLAIFLHELGHSALVWYGGGQRTTPKSDGVDREAGVYMETRYFGGIVVGAFDTKTKVIKDVGLSKGKDFYSVDNQRAAELLKLDTKNGLPFLDVSGESPDPKAPGTSTSKFWPVKTPSRLLSSTRLSNIRPFLVDDKKVVP
ncbi:hypothetical protein D9615_003038 [Tricholomella constricta]|uniref:Uncharacterized protein n=1 Tax=Tricholomella constricta TaxID=117010 RepID=A0A8H5HGA6_9AGAR|nr:hypothetical protein D9615_003038 [Tricholomella constricta]